MRPDPKRHFIIPEEPQDACKRHYERASIYGHEYAEQGGVKPYQRLRIRKGVRRDFHFASPRISAGNRNLAGHAEPVPPRRIPTLSLRDGEEILHDPDFIFVLCGCEGDVTAIRMYAQIAQIFCCKLQLTGFTALGGDQPQFDP